MHHGAIAPRREVRAARGPPHPLRLRHGARRRHRQGDQLGRRPRPGRVRPHARGGRELGRRVGHLRRQRQLHHRRVLVDHAAVHAPGHAHRQLPAVRQQQPVGVGPGGGRRDAEPGPRPVLLLLDHVRAERPARRDRQRVAGARAGAVAPRRHHVPRGAGAVQRHQLRPDPRRRHAGRRRHGREPADAHRAGVVQRPAEPHLHRRGRHHHPDDRDADRRQGAEPEPAGRPDRPGGDRGHLRLDERHRPELPPQGRRAAADRPGRPGRPARGHRLRRRSSRRSSRARRSPGPRRRTS